MRRLASPLVALALALAGCAPVAVPADMLAEPPLRVAGRPDVMEVGPLLYAAEQAGPAVVMTPGGIPNLFDVDPASPAAQAALDRFPGRADVAGQAETQALRLSLAHPDLRIIMTVTEGVYRIVGRRSAGIERLGDLKGKRVGTFARTSAAYFLHRMLTSAGLTETDVTLVSLRPHELAGALADRRVDAVAIWEPASEQGRRAIGADAIEFQDPRAYRELYNLNTTAGALADPAKRARIVAFVRHVIDAARQSESAPAKVWPLLARQSGFDPDLIAASWPHHRFPAALPDDLLDVLVAEEAWLASQDGRPARSRAELARLIDPTVLRDALASSND